MEVSLGFANSAAPVYGNQIPAPLSLDNSGALRVTGNVNSTPSGTQNVNISSVTANIAMAAFQPLTGNAPSVTAAVANTSATLNIPTLPATNPTIRIVIDGNQMVAWAYGNVTATMNGSVQMLANTVELFAAPSGLTQISHIGAATGSNIRVTVGAGGSS